MVVFVCVCVSLCLSVFVCVSENLRLCVNKSSTLHSLKMNRVVIYSLPCAAAIKPVWIMCNKPRQADIRAQISRTLHYPVYYMTACFINK